MDGTESVIEEWANLLAGRQPYRGDVIDERRIRERRLAAQEVKQETEEPADEVAIGVDVARYGADRTAICVRRGDRVLEIRAYHREDTMNTTGRVVAAIREHNPVAVCVDVVGVGAGVVDRLKELGHKQVQGINGGSRPSKPEMYLNLRAELYDGLRWRFENDRIRIPNDAELIGQMAAVRYEFTSAGQMQIESKDVLASRGLPSPDKADALALCFAEVKRATYRIWV